ncbi:hypothetical protein JCM8097_001084 [Rhodosporidiobolus ruineniae]
MDFADAVHKALERRSKGDPHPADPAAEAPPDGHSTASSNKHRPPQLSLLLPNGSTHPTSSGASPAASRAASPARPPPPPASNPKTPTSPSRRSSYNPFHRPTPLDHVALSNSPPASSNRSSPAQSRSPSRRQTAEGDFPFFHHPHHHHPHRPASTTSSFSETGDSTAAALFPPPVVVDGPPDPNGLGLDTPRPKHRTQASFDWFGDAYPRSPDGLPSPSSATPPPNGIPPYLLGSAGGGGGADSSSSSGKMRRTDSPARLDLSRSSSTSTSTGGGFSSLGGGGAAAKGKGKAPMVDRRGRGKQGSTESTVPEAEESEWEDELRSPTSPTSGGAGGGSGGYRTIGLQDRPAATPPAHSRHNSGQGHGQGTDGPSSPAASSGLRGAFTLSDLERGARRLRGDDEPARAAGSGSRDSTPSRRMDWKRRASALPASFRSVAGRASASRKPSAKGDTSLARTQSAGDAEASASGGGTGSPSLAQQQQREEGRARSIHATGGEDDAEWEDEVRDRFDAEAPPPTSRPAPNGRKSSLWGFPHHRTGVGAGEGGSGASTPRDQPASEDEGGEGAKTPRSRPGVGARRGSAWNVVRERLRGEKAKKKKEAQGASLTGHELITELTLGVLPLVLIKMAVMDRDERGDRRIPILMNYLKLRITDSVYPFHDRHAIFRIELEYGDGAVKWVIYRELKDFVNLHAHYRVANLRQGIDKFPTFPKTSLPYLNWLKSERGGKGNVGKAEFARAQREALENYLLKLIKATMFGPGANRLCKFFEISAMSIMLSTRGGEQGKQGYLRITSSGASRKKTPGFHPLEWKNRHEPKWFIVRDSYIVAVDDPASTEIYDVIMVDSTFEIERPTRVYRKGLNLLHPDSSSADDLNADPALRQGALDLLADEPKPQGRRGAGDPNDPSSSRHQAVKGRGSGEGEKEKESDPEKAATAAGEDGVEGEREKHDAPGATRHEKKHGILHPHKKAGADDKDKDQVAAAAAEDEAGALKSSSQHTFLLRSSERKLRLVAKTERQQDQFVASVEKMLAKTIWAGRNRFDSFAPIRLNVAAQWLIDGRDYFWSLSRAIALAKHKIYIHDWWLSPELYLRRPPIDNQKWRLDRLLQRKAREGVQIFVIVYKEVSNDFTPVESAYTKTRLRGLHPNIHVQRSPSHTSTGTLLWSHHEKMCVIDETIGFMGGLDLCFGRWDTPGHVLIDDGPNLLNESDPQNVDRDQAQHSQIWPGKDYSNQRVLDFHTLSKPDEDMYDRGKVPRQPWHDIGLQIIGQPARDLCRHFIQRWNYLLRIKNHTVKMPFLLPAPDFTPQQLQEQRITGTCEVQICRSVGPWSMGISHIEHSIQNAYIKAIQLSDHFVYIENQFFVTSTQVEGTIIENKIGDALVSRIVRAHSEGTPWRCIIIVPTVPGYPYPLDHSEASSVRLIMECQYASICRGEHSIFARLRREGIDPDEYISFFGLRAWGKLSSGALTTESTYIHAKGMIVDDRIAIIGSANINERSQRGDRDSELACIIRDTDMIDSTMAGKPYQVGRFAHTMRVRLMREHLGIDVDELEAAEGRAELEAREPEKMEEKEDEWDPDHEQSHGTNRGAAAGKTFQFVEGAVESTKTYAGHTIRGATEAASRGMQKSGHKVKTDLHLGIDEAENKPPSEVDEDEETEADKIVRGQKGTEGFASTVVPTLEEKMMAEHRPDPKNVEEGGIRKLRQQAQREREDGPATEPSAHSREADEMANDSERADHPKANGGAPQPKESEEGKASQKKLGDKVTQTSEIDDTRKLDMIDDDDQHEQQQNGQPKIEVTPAPPRDDAAPPDVAKADQGYRSRSRSTSTAGGSEGVKSASSSSNLQRTSSQSKGNEQAVNRNTITGTLRKNLKERGAYTIPLPAPKIDPYGFTDPIVDWFYKDVWLAAAVRNTQVYRKVFRCMPDDLVQTWKQYREFQNWAERHNKAPKDVVPPGNEAPHSDVHGHSGQHGAGGGGSAGGVVGQGNDEPGETVHEENKKHRLAGWTAPGEGGEKVPGAKEGRDYTQRAKDYAEYKLDSFDQDGREKPKAEGQHQSAKDGSIAADLKAGEEELERQHQRGTTITRRARGWTLIGGGGGGGGGSADDASSANGGSSMTSGNHASSGGSAAGGVGEKEKKGRGRSGTTAGLGGADKDGAAAKGGKDEHDDALPEEEREQMEQLLEEVTGQLVVFPTRFLEAESAGGNFLFSKDRIPPMAIYD